MRTHSFISQKYRDMRHSETHVQMWSKHQEATVRKLVRVLHQVWKTHFIFIWFTLDLIVWCGQSGQDLCASAVATQLCFSLWLHCCCCWVQPVERTQLCEPPWQTKAFSMVRRAGGVWWGWGVQGTDLRREVHLNTKRKWKSSGFNLFRQSSSSVFFVPGKHAGAGWIQDQLKTVTLPDISGSVRELFFDVHYTLSG